MNNIEGLHTMKAYRITQYGAGDKVMGTVTLHFNDDHAADCFCDEQEHASDYVYHYDLVV